MSKYHSRKVHIDGYVFDSRLEAKRYSYLRLLEKAGEISNLKIHPKFILIAPFVIKGKHYRAITYTADFSYFEKGEWIVEDTKGLDTDGSRLRRKLMAYINKINVRIITKDDV